MPRQEEMRNSGNRKRRHGMNKSRNFDRDYDRLHSRNWSIDERVNTEWNSERSSDRGVNTSARQYGQNFGKGPKGWKRSDDLIRDEACQALSDSYFVDASGIDLTVKEGCIFLRGQVDSRDAKREAERCVDNIRGVTDVRNELTVGKGMSDTHLS